MEQIQKYHVDVWTKDTGFTVETHEVLKEEVLAIRVEGRPYSIIMRTPGDETFHVAGFCFTEGIIDSPEDIASIAFCDTHVATLTLKPECKHRIGKIIDRKGFISQTSCGICGKELISDLVNDIQPLSDNAQISIEKILFSLLTLTDYQPLRKKTRAAHAAVIYDEQFNQLSSAEDVGRHNALDKAIGKIFLNGRLIHAWAVVMSSRISYELVQKTARSRIPIISGISRPTSLAIELASALNMTLITLNQESGLYIFCGKHRLTI
ncbi:MAG: formate dehydrogenase accessory sulfurtransferase FdhD [Desulfobacterales bacterium]|nr:formate dehydrogenase accessory sulfurtransferase FdhD [Desulfobacterales bacterium]